MNYMPVAKDSWQVIRNGNMAFVSRYALGRDYHKVLRARLQKLADKITAGAEHCNHRVFTDSAPVMEVEWHKIRAWVARQAYTAAFAPGWLHVLPGRNIYRYARGCGYTYRQLLRKLHEVY
jgi:hypothetical protein